MATKAPQDIDWDRIDKSKFFFMGIGAFSGVTTLLYPLSVIKTNQQAAHGAQTTAQTTAMIWKTRGLPGFYRGYATVIFGTIPARMVYLSSLEMTKSAVAKAGQQLGLDETVIAGSSNFAGGAISSLITQVVTVPMDVVSQRQMVYSTGTSPAAAAPAEAGGRTGSGAAGGLNASGSGAGGASSSGSGHGGVSAGAAAAGPGPGSAAAGGQAAHQASTPAGGSTRAGSGPAPGPGSTPAAMQASVSGPSPATGRGSAQGAGAGVPGAHGTGGRTGAGVHTLAVQRPWQQQQQQQQRRMQAVVAGKQIALLEAGPGCVAQAPASFHTNLNLNTRLAQCALGPDAAGTSGRGNSASVGISKAAVTSAPLARHTPTTHTHTPIASATMTTLAPPASTSLGARSRPLLATMAGSAAGTRTLSTSQAPATAGAGAALGASALQIVRVILKEEGVMGLYRGFGASIITYVPSSAVWWGCYGLYQKVAWRILGDGPILPQRGASAASWGAVAPDAPAALSRADSGFGSSISAAGAAVRAGAVRPAATNGSSKLTEQSAAAPGAASAGGGGGGQGGAGVSTLDVVLVQTMASCLAGMTSAGVTAPLDLIKTRIQVAQKQQGQAVTFRAVFAEVLREDGWAGFFRAAGPRMANSALWGTAMMSVYEALKRFSVKET